MHPAMRALPRTRRLSVVAVVVAVALGLPALLGIAVAVGFVITPSVDDMPHRVDAILAKHDGTRVSLNDVPDPLSEALIAIEDERFYQHRGIDTQGLVRAALTDLYHHRARQFNVLAQMVHVGYIREDQAATAYSEPIGFPC